MGTIADKSKYKRRVIDATIETHNDNHIDLLRSLSLSRNDTVSHSTVFKFNIQIIVILLTNSN